MSEINYLVEYVLTHVLSKGASLIHKIQARAEGGAIGA